MARLRIWNIFVILMMTAAIANICRIYFKPKYSYISKFPIVKKLVNGKRFSFSKSETSKPISADTVLRKGNGIIFLETTDRMEPPSLVLCSIESVARVYPDRSVVFFMKGLKDIKTEKDEERAKQRFPSLSSFGNVYLFPLRMDQLFDNTPLMAWYDKVNPKKEIHWPFVISDACRIALVWKYGGIYLDYDIILVRTLPKDHFLAAEEFSRFSNGAFHFSAHHKLMWQFMEDFVKNYRGEIWAHKGPGLFTRVLNNICGKIVFKTADDLMCRNITLFHLQRFYPIPVHLWKRYYEVWQPLPTFNNSYGLHLWNHMKAKGISMVPGSNTLVEHLFQKYCPTTYDYILRNFTHENVL